MPETLPEEYYEWLENLQTNDFVIVELTLYLDTHPDDMDAIKQYNTYSKRSKELRRMIEEKYGPLQEFGNSYSTYPWAWNQPPWPWQV